MRRLWSVAANPPASLMALRRRLLMDQRRLHAVAAAGAAAAPCGDADARGLVRAAVWATDGEWR